MDSRLCEDCVKYPYSGNIVLKVGRETTTPYGPALLDLMMLRGTSWLYWFVLQLKTTSASLPQECPANNNTLKLAKA